MEETSEGDNFCRVEALVERKIGECVHQSFAMQTVRCQCFSKQCSSAKSQSAIKIVIFFFKTLFFIFQWTRKWFIYLQLGGILPSFCLPKSKLKENSWQLRVNFNLFTRLRSPRRASVPIICQWNWRGLTIYLNLNLS